MRDLGMASSSEHAMNTTTKDLNSEVSGLYASFADRLNLHDVDGLLELFADDAVFVPAPGQPVVGAAIKEGLAGFAQITEAFSAKVRTFFASGDIVLAIVDWELKGKDAQGAPLALKGTTADVLRRDESGALKFAIDNPFGTTTAS